MEKTIKEIADSLGVDKQRVYRYIKKNHIKSTSEAHHKVFQGNTVFLYDEAAIELIKQGLSQNTAGNEAYHEAHHEVRQNHIKSATSDMLSETLIAMLQNELEVKNNQIAELNKRLSEVTAALRAEQERVNAAQALHAGTIQATLEAAAPSEPAQKSASDGAVHKVDQAKPFKDFISRLLRR